jgi:hypothetical protein
VGMTPKKARPLTRRDWCLIFGTVILGPILIVAILVGVPLFYLHWSCSEFTQPFPSPDGKYVALVVGRGCGGAAGSVTSAVRVRQADESDAAAETVLSAGIGLKISLTWLDDRSLVIDYAVSPDRQQYVGQVKQPKSGILVRAQSRAP